MCNSITSKALTTQKSHNTYPSSVCLLYYLKVWTDEAFLPEQYHESDWHYNVGIWRLLSSAYFLHQRCMDKEMSYFPQHDRAHHCKTIILATTVFLLDCLLTREDSVQQSISTNHLSVLRSRQVFHRSCNLTYVHARDIDQIWPFEHLVQQPWLVRWHAAAVKEKLANCTYCKYKKILYRIYSCDTQQYCY